VTLSRITSYRQLKRFLEPLRALYLELDGKWEPELNEAAFLLKLIEFFEPHNYFFGELSPEGKIKYFAALITEEPPKAHFWLFFMNKEFRTETQQLLLDMSEVMMAAGYHIIMSRTGRTEKSYERWLSKFGAKKVEVVYRFDLTQIKR
jgi:hypothetical protein